MNDTNVSDIRTLGTWDLVFQGLGQITPITILSGLIVSIVGLSGINAPLAMMISFIAVILAANTIYQFSGMISHTGGYYSYVEYGLGKHLGKFTGLQYLLYQTSNLALEYFIVIWGFSKSLDYAFGTSLPEWTGILWMGAMMALSYILMRRGAKPSLRLALILGSIQVAFVIALSIIVIPSAHDNSVQTFVPSAGSGWTGVFLGFIVGGYLAFAGYGSVVPMGEEARSPRKTIRNAIIAIVVIAGSVFILGSYAMVVGFGLNNIGSFSAAVIPGLIVARRFTGMAGAIFFIAVSTFLSTYGTVI
ncbi:amino acid permease, partial [Thermoplasma sp.]|uniref:amino acid permease n=1 Tax=Thermoplasma sp. TaxID=1973142 RepID=UPI001277A005